MGAVVQAMEIPVQRAYTRLCGLCSSIHNHTRHLLGLTRRSLQEQEQEQLPFALLRIQADTGNMMADLDWMMMMHHRLPSLSFSLPLESLGHASFKRKLGGGRRRRTTSTTRGWGEGLLARLVGCLVASQLQLLINTCCLQHPSSAAQSASQDSHAPPPRRERRRERHTPAITGPANPANAGPSRG